MRDERVLASLLLIALIGPAAHAAGTLLTLQETPIGEFNGVAYTRYTGAFEGDTSMGFYRVPFEITAPTNTEHGNKSVWVEPSHFAGQLGTRDAWVQRDFIFGRGFSFAGIGWSSFGLSILDPSPGFEIFIGGLPFDPMVFIQDPEIISDFGDALGADAEARRLLGKVRNRYVVGFSQTSEPVRGLIESGLAEGVFDGALTFVNASFTGVMPLQDDIGAGTYSGKVIVLNTEFDNLAFGAGSLDDDGTTPDYYRSYAVPGASHVPDALLTPFAAPSSPASYIPELRAHFWQLHKWVSTGRPPPASTKFERDQNGNIVRDRTGNALTVDITGERTPRAPYIELGEATYISLFVGIYQGVQTIADLGFASFNDYLKAFVHAAESYKRAGLMLEEDETDMLARAGLCPGSTYTENYRDRYAQFVAIVPCP